MQAIKDSKDQKERNSLTVLLAFVHNVHPDILSDIEDLIKSSNTTTDPLILAYGSLASSLSPQLQHRIIKFLYRRIDQSNEEALIHLIHAMGNTESNLTEKFLILLLSHKNPSVYLSAIYALRYCIGSMDVQQALLNALHSNPPETVTEMILRTLIAGAQYDHLLDSTVIGEPLFEAVVTATKVNIELRAMLVDYVKLLGPRSPKHWAHMLTSHYQKRGTTWNENNNLYNMVLDLGTRSSDIVSYPSNKAYLWSKSLGISLLGLDTAFGSFAGFGGNANPTSYKLFAKGIARGHAFGYSKTAFEALILSENKPGGSSIQNRVYISILDKVLVDRGSDIPNCKNWTFPLYKSPDYTLLRLSYKIFIYIGYLDFSVTLSARLAINAGITACLKECAFADGTLVPSITITAGGSAAISFLVGHHALDNIHTLPSTKGHHDIMQPWHI